MSSESLQRLQPIYKAFGSNSSIPFLSLFKIGDEKKFFFLKSSLNYCIANDTLGGGFVAFPVELGGPV